MSLRLLHETLTVCLCPPVPCYTTSSQPPLVAEWLLLTAPSLDGGLTFGGGVSHPCDKSVGFEPETFNV